MATATTPNPLNHGSGDNDVDLEARLLEVETTAHLNQIVTGVPPPGATMMHRAQLKVIHMVNPKLQKFGLSAGAIISSVVLLFNVLYVWIFVSAKLMTMLDADWSADSYKQMYMTDHVAICSSEQYDLYLDSDHYESINGTYEDLYLDSGWMRCHLPGMSCSDYAFGRGFGASCSEEVQDEPEGYCLDDNDYCTDRDCSCGGQVSVTYVTCPDFGTVLGVALGYVTIIQLFSSSIIMLIYISCCGKGKGWDAMREVLKNEAGAVGGTIAGEEASKE